MNHSITYNTFLNLLFALVILLPVFSFAQKRSSYSKEVSDYDSCNLKLDSAKVIFDKNPEKALDLVEAAILIAIKNSYPEIESKAYQVLGDFNFDLKEYDLSLKNYENALRVYSTSPVESSLFLLDDNVRSEKKTAKYNKSNEKQITLDYKNLYKKAGLTALYLNKPEVSKTYFIKLLTLSGSGNDQANYFFAKQSLADIDVKIGQYEEAETYYNEILNHYTKQADTNSIINLNIKLGNLFKAQNQPQKAISYYSTARDLALKTDDDESVNIAFDNISKSLNQQRDIPSQMKVNQEAMRFNEERGNVKELAKNSIDMGNLYLETDSSSKAIEQLERGVVLSDESGDIETKSKAVKALSEAYEKEGEEDIALEMYKEYIELEDSVNKRYAEAVEMNKQKGRLLENTQNKVLILEKDKELNIKTIELLQREKRLKEEQVKRQYLLIIFLTVGLGLLVITSLIVYRNNRLRRKANRLLMLKSLRSQMNPHFIFNALNSVNNYISSNNERAANKYLADFSKLMRNVLENSGEDFIPLIKEIEILELYLKLEHSRFKDKFEYLLKIDESIRLEKLSIPPMLIQPYIENAVWHGLRYKAEKGFLEIEFKNTDQNIEIVISDNGIGRKRSMELKTENQKIIKSTGLKNIANRINIIREIYHVKLDVIVLDLIPETGEGTVVKLYLNKQTFQRT
ncbi:MAG: histidine kinase [Bacteroidales bacterium]|nr:histidine kinase [Bacteroidales bacterium]